MIKYKIVVQYDGTSYHGWQVQRGVPTIQLRIEQVLGRILACPTRVHGAGRTDAGVHAAGQVAHFLADWNYSTADLQKACNALLPQDIAITSLEPTDDDFHARFAAKSKTYVYTILSQPLRSPLMRLYAWHIPQQLVTHDMNRAAEYLTGSHDFSAFGSPTDGSASTIREILEARWDPGSPEGILQFTIQGTGFLRYMVRCIVGTLLLVGRGKISHSEFASILDSRERCRSGPTAPPHGLCLHSIDYSGPGGSSFGSESEVQNSGEF
jgi:tRNA pseudouridine38-40 synthase